VAEYFVTNTCRFHRAFEANVEAKKKGGLGVSLQSCSSLLDTFSTNELWKQTDKVEFELTSKIIIPWAA
jgi:hypothetical protein